MSKLHTPVGEISETQADDMVADAESFVSEAIGLDTNSACADYIQLYQGSVETLTESLESIQLASSLILSELMPEEPHAAAA